MEQLSGAGRWRSIEINEKDKPIQKIPFASLIDNGHLKPGAKLYNNKKSYKATILPDGSISYKNERGSIHKIAAKIMGAESYNGWTYWHYDLNGSSVLIDSLRQKFIAEKQI